MYSSLVTRRYPLNVTPLKQDRGRGLILKSRSRSFNLTLGWYTSELGAIRRVREENKFASSGLFVSVAVVRHADSPAAARLHFKNSGVRFCTFAALF